MADMTSSRHVRHEQFRRTKERLVEAGVSLGTIDAFEAAVRAIECEVVADALEAHVGDSGWSVGRLDPQAVRAIAGEVRRFR